MRRPYRVLLIGLLLGLFCVSCEHELTEPEPPPIPEEPGPEPDAFWELTGVDSVVDAEYDKVHERIIAVTAGPDQLLIIDPADSTVSAIALNTDPTCVSVSEDGNTAVAGHNGWVSWVDLNSLALLATHGAGCDVFDVVLGPNGFAYAFPESDQWTEIRCIELSSGTLTSSGGWSIYEETNARLKPGSTRIYGATNNGSPTDVETYDISAGTATYLYDCAYHGDYPFGGGLWFSESGDRLFTRDRTVLTTSMVQSEDMLYAGTLPGEAHVRCMDHSSEADRVYAIHAWKPYELAWNGGVQVDTVIHVCTGGFLDDRGAIPLPRAWRNESWHPFGGCFGFFNSAGTYFHTIMRADLGAGEVLWAVSTIEAEDP